MPNLRAILLGFASFLLIYLLGCSPEPSFSISLSSVDLSTELGLEASVTLTATRTNLANSVPILVVLEAPQQGFKAAPVTIKESGSATFTISPDTVNTGGYELTLKASTSDPPITRMLTLRVVVRPPGNGPSLTLSAPDTFSMAQDDSQTISVTVTRNNFQGAVQVTAEDSPPGVSVAPLEIGTNNTNGNLQITTAASAQVGVSNLRLVAKTADIIATTILELTVTQTNIPPAPERTELVIEDFLTGLEIPWDMTFSEDGTLYFTERRGNVKRYANGVLTELENNLPVYAFREAGLLGLTLDPNFSSNQQIYLCYSYSPSDSNTDIRNRVSRLTVSGNAITNELILIDEIPGNQNHDGCRLLFAPDGTLFVTTGDARQIALPQDTTSLAGKVLRINPDGSIPTGNPFGNAVWSYGHRNAQGLTLHPNGNLYATEHGDASDDEINLIRRGANYGWPDVEGFCNLDSERTFCNSTDVAEPLVAYTPTLAVSNMVAYDAALFPDLQGKLLFVSLKAGEARVLTLNDDGTSVTDDSLLSFGDDAIADIEQDFGRLRDIEISPDGSIYLATSNRDGRANAPFPGAADDRIIIITKR